MGRILKFGKPSKILTIRVPEESFDEIKEQMNKLLKQYPKTPIKKEKENLFFNMRKLYSQTNNE